MSSINTNSSAMTALQTLTQTNKALETTQRAISTGYRVSTASDNAAYWSIATTMRSDNKALSTVKDALGLGSAMVDITYTALEKAVSVVDEIKAKLVAAREPGVDKGKIQSEISELQNQLQAIAESASFSGENWLAVDSSAAGYTATKEIVSSFSRTGGAVSVSTIDITLTSIKLFDTAADTATSGNGIIDAVRGTNGVVLVDQTAAGFSIAALDISTLTNSAADVAILDSYITGADTALSDLADAATLMGSVQSRIDLQKDFVDALMDAIDRGVGQLVDADMNEESTRLQALQVQQQLGVQSLSIANANTQNILALFQ